MLFQMAGKLDKRVKQMIENVVEECEICWHFKKTPPWPKVALPKAVSTNEVVSLDLKERRDVSKYILYACDEFCGYLSAINIKNPETIIKAFHKKWIREGPGIPKYGVFSDNGGEFRNPALREMASKYGITLTLTAAHSPWSNGR